MTHESFKSFEANECEIQADESLRAFEALENELPAKDIGYSPVVAAPLDVETQELEALNCITAEHMAYLAFEQDSLYMPRKYFGKGHICEYMQVTH